jgi:hypothetical protein
MKTQKELQTHLNSLEQQAKIKQIGIAQEQKALSLMEKSIKEIRIALDKAKNPAEPTVSEHAILRYLERVEGVDIDAIRAKILNPKILGFIEVVGGAGTFPHEDGFKIAMKKNIVTTIIVK